MDEGALTLWELELLAWRRRLGERADATRPDAIGELLDSIAELLATLRRRPPRGRLRADRALRGLFAQVRALDERRRAQAGSSLDAR